MGPQPDLVCQVCSFLGKLDAFRVLLSVQFAIVPTSIQISLICGASSVQFVCVSLPLGITASTARPPSPTELGEPVFVHVEEEPEKDHFGLDSDSDGESTEFAQRIYSSQPFAGTCLRIFFARLFFHLYVEAKYSLKCLPAMYQYPFS